MARARPVRSERAQEGTPGARYELPAASRAAPLGHPSTTVSRLHLWRRVTPLVHSCAWLKKKSGAFPVIDWPLSRSH